ncbi:MAG: CDP-alcohol phosphatidyltransferase family protein [Nanoarchaeota archaeon]
MKKKEKEFEDFKKKTLHPKEELLAILTVNHLTVRIAYFIKKHNLNISPNQVTSIRLFLLFPLITFLLFLAPIMQYRLFYLLAAIGVYFMAFTDDLDGNIARGLDKKSKYGAFLDSIADRAYTFILLIFIFSFGMWTNHTLLIYGALFALTLKSFHLMIISKVYYYNPNSSVTTIFPEFFQPGNKVMVSLNKIFKIKRWCENFGGFERIFLAFMLPAILFYFGFELIVFVMVYALTIFNIYFYLSRTRNLIRDYEGVLNKK